ncbi:MAG: nucleotide exchange factor GrpE [Candidatus Paceibacterota bacterium]|jgi:molecular chaperone GrpE
MEENNNQNPIEEKITGELEEVDEVRDEKEKLEKCEVEKGEYLAGWQRAKADFINYKKDEIKRLEEFAKYSNEELIRELIGIMDNFDIGLAALEKSGPVEKGIYMIRNQIDDILKKRGLEKISVKPGEDFNPGLAEAMSEVESKYPPGAVAEEIEPGYKIYEKLIRPARVKLSKGQKA